MKSKTSEAIPNVKQVPLKEMYTVMCTKDYQAFKFDQENRVPDHADKIISSVKEVGLVPTPIIVNEDFEIIDGQNRFVAFEHLGMPVYYMMIPGLQIEHCRALNIGQKNWTLRDFVKSYSVNDASYQYLSTLMDRYNGYSVKVISAAIGGYGFTGSSVQKRIITGTFYCSKEQYEMAIRTLEWIKSMEETTLKVNGKLEYIRLALVFVFNTLSFQNRQRFYKNYTEKAMSRDSIKSGIVNMDSAINAVDDVYNFRNNKNYVDIKAAYRSATRSGRKGKK